jgi:hypothetical protein
MPAFAFVANRLDISPCLTKGAKIGHAASLLRLIRGSPPLAYQHSAAFNVHYELKIQK